MPIQETVRFWDIFPFRKQQLQPNTQTAIPLEDKRYLFVDSHDRIVIFDGNKQCTRHFEKEEINFLGGIPGRQRFGSVARYTWQEQ